MVDGLGSWQKNIIIAGGTGSGKTSTLNSLTIFIRDTERMVKGRSYGCTCKEHPQNAPIHANNSRECMTRLTNEPMSVPTIMIPALDLVIMQPRISRGDKGSIRRITEITEIGGVTDDVVGLSKIYEWDPAKDVLKSTGTPSKLRQDLAKGAGVPLKEVNDEIERRQLILDYLVKEGIRELSKVRGWVEDLKEALPSP